MESNLNVDCLNRTKMFAVGLVNLIVWWSMSFIKRGAPVLWHGCYRLGFINVQNMRRREPGLLEYAECARTGEMRHIFDVPTGEECGCVLPGTSIRLIAKNKGKSADQILLNGQRKAHFALAAGGDLNAVLESELHLLAKRVFQEEKRLYLPAVEMSPQFKRRVTKEITEIFSSSKVRDADEFLREVVYPEAKARMKVRFKGADIDFHDVQLEVAFDHKNGCIRADAVGFMEKTKLIVEFKLTHEVDEEKRKKILSMGFSCVEIDISGVGFLDENQLLNRRGIRELLNERLSTSKRWVFNSRQAKFEDELLDVFVKKAQEYVIDAPRAGYREYDQLFYQKRRQAGYEHIPVSEPPKKVCCPALSRASVAYTYCSSCRYFGGWFRFTKRGLLAGDVITLCGYELKLTASVLGELIQNCEKGSTKS